MTRNFQSTRLIQSLINPANIQKPYNIRLKEPTHGIILDHIDALGLQDMTDWIDSYLGHSYENLKKDDLKQKHNLHI